jgi:uncharacterized protein YbbK (DUF523 family)
MEKRRVGLSACLLGESVRYDGGHKLNSFIADEMSGVFELFPLCPEVEAGLSVPREPMHLEGEPSAPRLVGLKTRTDHTEKFAHWAEMRLGELESEGLSGFILKARSPSCGPDFAEITHAGGTVTGPGLFARALMERFPDLPVIDEVRLRQPGPREEFIRRAQAL